MYQFRKILTRLWNDELFRRLDTVEQHIALYALIGQSNRVGLFKFSVWAAIDDLGWVDKPTAEITSKRFGLVPPNTTETFGGCLDRICEALGWEYDSAARVLFIPTWWKYNCPRNPNVLKSYLGDLGILPETPLLHRFKGNTKYLSGTFLETFRSCLGVVSGFAPQTEKKTENKTKKENQTDRRPNSRPDPPLDSHSENGEKKPKRPKLAPDPIDVALAEWMYERLLAVNPGHKKPAWAKWHNDLRKLRTLDHRTEEQIRHLFTWANEHKEFWQANILSPESLRAKWDKLTLQSQRTGKGSSHADIQAGPGFTYHPDAVGDL